MICQTVGLQIPMHHFRFSYKEMTENSRQKEKREDIFGGITGNYIEKEGRGLDILTTMQAISPFKAGLGLGVIVLIYGYAKMELSFGLLGFVLCFIAGIVSELFI